MWMTGLVAQLAYRDLPAGKDLEIIWSNLPLNVQVT